MTPRLDFMPRHEPSGRQSAGEPPNLKVKMRLENGRFVPGRGAARAHRDDRGRRAPADPGRSAPRGLPQHPALRRRRLAPYRVRPDATGLPSTVTLTVSLPRRSGNVSCWVPRTLSERSNARRPPPDTFTRTEQRVSHVTRPTTRRPLRRSARERIDAVGAFGAGPANGVGAGEAQHTGPVAAETAYSGPPVGKGTGPNGGATNARRRLRHRAGVPAFAGVQVPAGPAGLDPRLAVADPRTRAGAGAGARVDRRRPESAVLRPGAGQSRRRRPAPSLRPAQSRPATAGSRSSRRARPSSAW